MKCVAGLGNPGGQYRGTRHNVGFDVIDRLVSQHGLAVESSPANAVQARWRLGLDVVLLVKPLTFMNVSGEAVAELCRYFKIAVADVLVVTDDVNLAVGRLRARAGGSEGGHNGLRSVAERLGTPDYARLRIGVGRGDVRRDLADHVLSRVEPDEREVLDRAIARAAEAVEVWAADGMPEMMRRFNGPADVGA